MRRCVHSRRVARRVCRRRRTHRPFVMRFLFPFVLQAGAFVQAATHSVETQLTSTSTYERPVRIMKQINFTHTRSPMARWRATVAHCAKQRPTLLRRAQVRFCRRATILYALCTSTSTRIGTIKSFSVGAYPPHCFPDQCMICKGFTVGRCKRPVELNGSGEESAFGLTHCTAWQTGKQNSLRDCHEQDQERDKIGDRK